LKIRQLNYTTGSKRFRYEVEVPHEFAKKMPEDFINTSNAKANARFQSDELRDMIN